MANKNTSLATIGMRRKGIAIAFIPKRSVNYVQYSSTYYLVNKDNYVILSSTQNMRKDIMNIIITEYIEL